MEWITAEIALAIHGRQLAEHGGLEGVRNMGGLESALSRPINLHAYGEKKGGKKGEENVFFLAAALAYGLIRNHPFVDGNKRTAYVCTRLFLKLHGEDFPDSPENRVQIFEELAAGNIEEKQLIEWLSTAPR